MQVAEKEMVRGEYPVPEEGKKEEDTEEVIQEENNPDNVNEEMDCAEDEEHADDIRCLEEDVYSDIGKYMDLLSVHKMRVYFRQFKN